MTGGESLTCSKSPPSCIINLAEFLENPKRFVHLVKEDDLLEDVQELKITEKILVLVFVVGKRTCNFFQSMKDTVIRSLVS